MRIRNKNCLSLCLGMISFRMFSVNVTDGANKVALAQLLIADKSAPKNITCANTGTLVMISVGKINCGSLSIRLATIFGSISVAEYAKNMGMNAKQKYITPPSTDARPAIFSFLDEDTRWNTSCCGIDPSIIVIHAAKNHSVSLGVGAGQKSSLPVVRSGQIPGPRHRSIRAPSQPM